MREVSCRLLDIFFRRLKAEQRDPALLAIGIPYTLQHLQNRDERIEWTTFAAVMRNAENLWSESQLETMGTEFFSNPLIRSFMAPARLLMSPRRFYRFVLGDSKGFGKNLVTSAENNYREIGSGEAVLTLTFPPDYEYSPGYFLVTKGALRGLPRALGLSLGTVRMEQISCGARYHIIFPSDTGFLAALRKSVTWPFTLRAVAREAEEAKQVMLDRYRQLEEARDNLEMKVHERTAELEAARDQLTQTVATLEHTQNVRERIFANINHEIRTPLSLMVLAVSEVIRRNPELDQTSTDRLQDIERAVARLLHLVDGLLLLAAGQEGKLKLEFAESDIAILVQQLVSTWLPKARYSELSLEYRGPKRFTATFDEAALERILTNFVSNAIKFTPAGGSIAVELLAADDSYEIRVCDTGIGIDEEFRRRIFGRFEQGRGAVQPGTPGSGIGLSIVKDLTEGHGGTVRVEDNVPSGSVFVLALPRLPSTRLHQPGQGSRVSRPNTTLLTSACPIEGLPEGTLLGTDQIGAATVLVAEDEPELRRAVVVCLAPHFRVLAAPDGEAALRLAKKFRPDILVSDVGMPGMDGYELTKKFRELDGNRLAPVVLLTAYGNISDRLTGFEAGALDYVLKPFNANELVARVQSQLGLRKTALKLHESEKLASLGIMSAGLAHELRNPANVVINAIEPLKMLLPKEIFEPATATGELFEILEQAARQINALSQQLLGFSRPGHVALAPSPLIQIIKTAESLVRQTTQGIEVIREVEAHIEVPCSKALLIQVFVNLLENSAHAVGPGGWIKVAAVETSDKVLIDVWDSGTGVPSELRGKIFDPFFTTKAPGKGTGLGLTISKTILERHGGHVELLERPGGTTFRITLPSTNVNAGTEKTNSATPLQVHKELPA